jgi:hypothetical protein
LGEELSEVREIEKPGNLGQTGFPRVLKDYFEKHRVLFQSVDPKVRKHIIAGTKRRVLKEGVLLEKFTFDEWVRHIEEL